MKKFEEAELNVMMLENCVISTSGGCTDASCMYAFDSGRNEYAQPE